MRTVYNFFKKALFIAALASIGWHPLLLAESSSAYEASLKKYGDEPVEAIREMGPNQFDKVTLFGFGADGISVTYPGFEGRIDLPEDRLPFVVIYEPNIQFSQYQSLIDAGQVEEGLEMLRKEAYPLLQYVNIDPSAVRVHNFVAQVLRELLIHGKVLEVNDIVREFSRERLTGGFRGIAVDTSRGLLQEGHKDLAYELVRRFPIGPGEITYTSIYLDIANQYRLLEDWERARNLYRDVQMASSKEETPEAFLWEAYIHLQEERGFMAQSILDDFATLPPDNSYYALVELVRGVLQEQAGETQRALSTLAKGLVYSTTNDIWTPELLYRVANLYEKLDEPTPALEIRRQLTFFYPDTIWAQRLQ